MDATGIRKPQENTVKHKKLTIKTETIRSLTARDLGDIGGGVITDTDSLLCTVGTCTAATLRCPTASSCGPGTADDDNG